jgi:hypothetical protein
MVELSLMRTLLKVLSLIGESGIRESILMDEVALAAAHKPTGDQIREHIQSAKDSLWIEGRKGLIQEPRYFITAAGKAALQEMA